MTPPPFMKTTSTTKANRLDGRTAQPGRASRFASAPSCSLSQVVWVVSNSISGTDDQRQPYSYQYYDNLLGGVYTNRLNGPRILATYEYDAEKRRRRKTMSSQETRHFTYSGWSLLCETLTTNHYQLTTYYVWGKDLSGTPDGAGGVGGLLATEVGGVWYFPLYDNNGNVTDYVSETGEVVASYTYDAFGRTIAQSGAMADEFPFRFSTKYYDAEAKLYYYGERFYSPELGRWLNRDPIEEDGGDNLYMFCGNNGVNAFDALGDRVGKWIEPTDKEGNAIPGAGNFPGAGWRDTFRDRPATFFDLSAKIHDLHYGLNDLGFGLKANTIGHIAPEYFHGSKAELSRKAKADYIFRLMNDQAKGRGLWTGFLNWASRRVFYDSPKYFCRGDDFANFAHQPEFPRLNNPDQYLMIPYVALGYKPMKREKKFRNGIPNSKFGYKYVLVPSYTDIATEDHFPGFIQWAESFYGATWGKIKEITSETDSSFR